jgi:hypothetical protein
MPALFRIPYYNCSEDLKCLHSAVPMELNATTLPNATNLLLLTELYTQLIIMPSAFKVCRENSVNISKAPSRWKINFLRIVMASPRTIRFNSHLAT